MNWDNGASAERPPAAKMPHNQVSVLAFWESWSGKVFSATRIPKAGRS
jgi:hypothetical protein